MWIFLWIVLSLFVLGIFFWSTAILQQQKKAWAAFAKKMNLAYTAGSFTSPPVVSGAIRNYRLVFYTDTQQTGDARGQRFITAIEMEMGRGMPTSAAIASPEYAAFLEPLRLNQSYAPPFEGWNRQIIIRAQDSELLARYLTPERLKTLHMLLSVKNAATLLFFDPEDSVLRIQTSDPLRNPDKMEKIARRIIAAADVLAPSEAERKAPPPAVVAAPPPQTPPQPDAGAQPVILPDTVQPEDTPK